MKITYSIWQGNNLLSVNNKANSPEEILAVMEELKKLGENFTYGIRGVYPNEQISNQHGADVHCYPRPIYGADSIARGNRRR